jgi:bifunctional non-homologous end joining protein LigD
VSLERYKAKRDFRQTKEPAGDKRSPRKRPVKKPGALFVIQKHAASRLHYDFRLEVDGTLKSWAVPKGVPTTKAEKRLAMHVEDHPLAYGGFEGTIPKGNYGAGTVMVWDTGTFEPLEGEAAAGLASGKFRFRLQGKKLKGEWTLVRMRGGEEGKEPWLLIKSGEDLPALARKSEDRSVVSGRSMDEITEAADHTWKSDRPSADVKKKPKHPRAAHKA